MTPTLAAMAREQAWLDDPQLVPPFEPMRGWQREDKMALAYLLARRDVPRLAPASGAAAYAVEVMACPGGASVFGFTRCTVLDLLDALDDDAKDSRRGDALDDVVWRDTYLRPRAYLDTPLTPRYPRWLDEANDRGARAVARFHASVDGC